MKLKVYIDYYHPTPDTNFVTLWYQSMIWAITEHGLSLFAASVLAIRPFFTFVSQTYGTLSSKMSYGSGSRKSVSARGMSSGRVSKASNWPGSPRSTEMGHIGVCNEFDVRSEYDAEQGLQQPVYRADAYGDDDSAKMLVREGSKGRLEVDAEEVSQ